MSNNSVNERAGLRPVIVDLVAVARPGHWFKNVFMLPGIALAILLADVPISFDLVFRCVLSVLAVCIISSGYYTLNEWLDAAFDRFHPTKKHRPSAAGRLNAPLAYGQWAVLTFAGLLLSAALGQLFLLFAIVLVVMSLLYNVPPIRTKNRIYLDVLSESLNNPLRFLLGWAAVTSTVLPPSSILLAYWMGGAFLMAVKRYSEYRFINDPQQAGLYRRSFQFYSERTLLLSALFYALSSAFFFGIFLIKYRIEFLLAVPGFSLLFVWYLAIGMEQDSIAQRPEELYTQHGFLGFVAALTALVAVLFVVDIPWLHVLVEPVAFGH